MSFDFTRDSALILQELSNADVVVGGSDPVRGIYDLPGRTGGGFGEMVLSTDPQVTLLQEDVVRLALTHNNALTVIPDRDDSVDYLVKSATPDGGGFSVLTLKRGAP
jgi:hypothetical protein